ncbi:hypothetical protein KY345_03855 [Candidatus Woesearchaeota archaeon]|nr:hypothetical protein [Candidatus Woesearchaeota archaeon]
MDKKEIARDMMALGGIPFLILVLVRIIMVQNYGEGFQIVFAIALFHLLSIKVKDMNFHAGVLPILAIFTSIFYEEWLYVIFAGLITILALYGMKNYLKIKGAYKSAVIAVICSITSYLISIPLGIPNLPIPLGV